MQVASAAMHSARRPLAETSEMSATVTVTSVHGSAVLGFSPATGVGHDDVPAAGRTLGRFVLLDTLGRGGMGVVCKAYDPALRREVALKFLHPDLEHDGRTQILREAQAMAQLSHPNVVTIYDVVLHADVIVIAMEYVRGQTLRSWLDGMPASGWPKVLHAFIQAGHGLAAAHRARLVHRDFKPANVFVSDENRILVGDFGIARHRHGARAFMPEQGDALEKELAGTPRYMAPEQHDGCEVDSRTDQYAYCVALWEALCGVPPFSGAELETLANAKASGPPPWPERSGARRVPRKIAAAVIRGLAPNPEQRWPSMPLLLAALEDASSSSRRKRRISAAVAVAASSVPWLWTWSVERVAHCSGAEGQLQRVWDTEQRDSARAALLQTGIAYAAQTADRAEAMLDRYAEEWAAQHRAICEATVVLGTQTQSVMDLRMSCLHRRKVELKATVSVLQRADEQVLGKAVQLASALPSLSRCSDVPALAAETPPPEDPVDAAKVEQASALLAEVTALQRAGRYEQALQTLEVADGIALDVRYAPVHAGLAHRRGLLLEIQGQYAAAEATLQRALDEALAAGIGEVAAQVASDLALVVGARQGRLAEGAWLIELAITLITRQRDGAEQTAAQTEIESYARKQWGTLLRAQGRYAESEAQQRQALALQERVYGSKHPNIAPARNSLAIALQDQGRYDAAEAEYRQVLSLIEAAYGDAHPWMAHAQGNLATVLHSLGRYDEAEALFRQALALREKVFGSMHPLVAQAHGNLASALFVLGRYDQAESEFRHALRLHEHLSGLDSADVAGARADLALALSARGRHIEAEAEQRIALASHQKIYGPEHPLSARMHGDLGDALSNLGRHADAEEEQRLAVAIYEKILGLEHPDALRPLTSLAGTLATRGNHREAEQRYRQALELALVTVGPEHPEAAVVHFAFGVFLVARDRLDEARQQLERAWSIHATVHISPNVRAATAFALAQLLWRTRADRRRAFELAELAQRDYRAAGDGARDQRLELTAWLAARR